MSDQSNSHSSPARPAPRRLRTFLLCAAIFLVAVGVRALHWQDNRHALPFAGMNEEYKAHALVLVEGDLYHFVRGYDPPSDANFVKHPPGYPLLLAAVYKVFGDSEAALVGVHVALDALAAVLVFLITAELFSVAPAFVAGMLVALSPQLAYHSIAPVPDPLAAPPILLAFLLLARATKRPRLRTVVAAGALIGVSCWIRSNALLLAPFVALLAPLLFERGRRALMASALVAASLAVIAPVTIRNAVVFKSFIPLSLSAGITLVEGIGFYDYEGRFGLPSSDYGVTKWEARLYNRPDYLGRRFKPDGVERERRRVAHGLAVIRENPGWFLWVMLRRAYSMPRLARVEVVADAPAVTRPLEVADGTQPARALSPAELSAGGAGRTELSLTADGRRLRFTSEGEPEMIVSPPLDVRPGGDYLLRLPLKIEQGGVVVDVTDAGRNEVLASTPVLHPVNWLELRPEEQPSVMIRRPFVSGESSQVRVTLRNGGRAAAQRVSAEVGGVEVFALGDSSMAWTRYPRLLVRAAQKLFLTATALPFIAVGVILMARARRWRALALLFAVPIYYMCAQSALWTEFRYILTLHYFLFIVAAVGLHWTGRALWLNAHRLKTRAVK